MSSDLPPVSDASRIDALEEHAVKVTEVIKGLVGEVDWLLRTHPSDVTWSEPIPLLLDELHRITDVVRSNHA